MKVIKPPKLFFNWSSGKDSALALYELLEAKQYKVAQLLTTIGKETNRISMHGLRRELLVRQCQAINLNLKIIELESSLDHSAYNKLMKNQLTELKSEGYSHAAFGDIFLEDLKSYRESQLDKIGIKGVFPLWQRPTAEVMNHFLQLGFKAIVVSANSKWFDENFVGTTLTKEVIRNFPKEVDPCGENGEFHTFCYDGPLFSSPVDFEIGKKVKKSYPSPIGGKKLEFWFCDLL